MANVGIFFGSDTGNTEAVAELIQNKLGEQFVDVHDIANTNKEEIENYNFLILGIPTWYYGEAQCDWDDFFPQLEKIDFSDKIVAVFGCGDQEDYAEYFCDAVGELASLVTDRGAVVVGNTSTDGYCFEQSKALLDENTFVGLCIDEDRQAELTDSRVSNWVTQIYDEMCLAELFK